MLSKPPGYWWDRNNRRTNRHLLKKKQFNGFPIAKIRLNPKASDLGTDDKSWKVNPRKLPL